MSVSVLLPAGHITVGFSTPKFCIQIVLPHLTCVFHKKGPRSRAEGDLEWSGLRISRCDAAGFIFEWQKSGKFGGSCELRGEIRICCFFFLPAKSEDSSRCVHVVPCSGRKPALSLCHSPPHFLWLSQEQPANTALFSKRQEVLD